MWRMQQGRTMLLITHRLSQIRWADLILVLDRGKLAACGVHDELLRTSPHYRRIFSRFDTALPEPEWELENKRWMLEVGQSSSNI
jgi:ATP-binding cassette subfamily B protein